MFLYRLEVFTLLFTILSNNLNHMSYTSHFTDQFVNEVSVNNLCVVRAKNMADANDVTSENTQLSALRQCIFVARKQWNTSRTTSLNGCLFL